MKECKKCGVKIADSMDVCSECNEPIQKEEPIKENLFPYFQRYCFLGVTCVVVGLIISMDVLPLIKTKILHHLVDILQMVFSSIGMALIIGTIFSYTLDTQKFIDYISQRLYKVIISKEFISKLDSVEKKNALQLILKPSDRQIKLYHNIFEYFNLYIDNSMRLFDTNFKSNLIINMYCDYDENCQKIYTDVILSHRIYKTAQKYEPIRVGFEDTNSVLYSAEIISPNGEKQLIDKFDQPEVLDDAGCKWREFSTQIPDKFTEFPWLNVKRNLREYGNDHWKMITYKAKEPTDGIFVSIRCGKDIVVKDYMIYDTNINYDVTIGEDRKSIEIDCYQWIKPGTGFSIIVAKENC